MRSQHPLDAGCMLVVRVLGQWRRADSSSYCQASLGESVSSGFNKRPCLTKIRLENDRDSQSASGFYMQRSLSHSTLYTCTCTCMCISKLNWWKPLSCRDAHRGSVVAAVASPLEEGHQTVPAPRFSSDPHMHLVPAQRLSRRVEGKGPRK